MCFIPEGKGKRVTEVPQPFLALTMAMYTRYVWLHILYLYGYMYWIYIYIYIYIYGRPHLALCFYVQTAACNSKIAVSHHRCAKIGLAAPTFPCVFSCKLLLAIRK